MTLRELTPGNIKSAMSNAGGKPNDIYNVDPANIIVREGYNVRVDNDANRAYIRWLADQMKAHGFNRKFALGVSAARVAGTDVIVLDAGHRRMAAAVLAISEGAPFATVPVIPSAKGTNEEDLTAELVTSNEGAPLTAYEKARVAQRLSQVFGWDSERIRARFGWASTQHVDDYLMLMASPIGIRRLVELDAVSVTEAVKMIKKHGDRALEAITAAIAASAKGRATAASAADPEAKAARKWAPQIYSAISLVRSDPGYGMLSPELREGLEDLMAQVTGVKV